MNLMIRIYMTVCVSLLVFDIVFLLVKNMRNNQLYPRNVQLERRIKKEAKRRKKKGHFSKQFEEDLFKLLKKTKNLITLYGQIEARPDIGDLFHEQIFAQVNKYKEKNDYEQAYYTYVISALSYDKKKIPYEYAYDFLYFLDSKSLYTFINAVNAFYKFGDVHLMIAAIEKIDKRSGFYHKKLLVDGLLTAKVDKTELCDHLVTRFENYTVHTQESLVDYFRMSGYRADELCLKIMKDEKAERELAYSAMRYFIKHHCAEAIEYFVEVLQKEEADWVSQMLAIQALAKASNPTIRQLVKEKITSKHWHVRINALKFLYENGLDKEEIYEILCMKDRYTNEAMLYQFKDDDAMTEYINSMMMQLQEQEEKV